MQQPLYDQIQKALQAGQLSQALDLLVTATHEADKALREDVLLLKSRFEYNRNQYEVKGILSDQEFNIHYSKTLLGAQEALERWRNGAGRQATLPLSDQKKRSWWPALAVIGLLAIAAIWYQLAGSGAEASPLTEDASSMALIDEPDEEENAHPNQTQSLPDEPQKTPAEKKTGGQVKAKAHTPVDTEEPAPAQAQPDEGPAEEPETATQAPPPAKTFEVLIVKNSDMADAEIYVDGRRAVILSSTPIITSIRVTEKQAMHTFELRGDAGACKKEQLITADKQRIIFNCN